MIFLGEGTGDRNRGKRENLKKPSNLPFAPRLQKCAKKRRGTFYGTSCQKKLSPQTKKCGIDFPEKQTDL